MGNKSDPSITKCKAGENWTKVTFRPDLAKFNMTYLEEDVVALMKKRVLDLAGTLGKNVKVELNGQRLPVKTFADYVNLYLQSASKSRPEPLPRLVLRASEFLIFLLQPFVDLKINSWLIHPTRIAEKANDRWEICVSLSEGQFQQVSVEVALNVAKSGVVNTLLTWADFKQSKELKKTDGAKRQRITGIPKLEDANDAGGKNSDKADLQRSIPSMVDGLKPGQRKILFCAFKRNFVKQAKKSATKEAGVTYTVTGAIEEVNDTTLKITELPVRRWTQDYKEFLESMMTGNDKSKEPFIKLLKLDNQVRFILGVVSGEIIVNNRKRADLFLELQQKGFTPMPKKTKGIDAAAAEATEDEEEDEQKEESPEAGKRGVKASDYEYLMSMPIGSLTLEKVQELCAEKDKLDGEVDELRRTSPRSLWLKELDALEEELDVSITATSEFVSLKLERKDAEAEEMRIKNNAGAGPSRQAPKKPRKNASNSSSVIGSEKTVTEAGQKKTKGGSKRAPPAKKVDLFFTSLMLRSLLLESLLHLTQVMETDSVVVEQQGRQKKQASRTAAARKATLTVLSDTEDDEAQNYMPPIEEDNDKDLNLMEPKGRKGRGRKPANEKAKPATTTRKRGPAQSSKPVLSQKLITEVLKPAENGGSSPEKKVRKMRDSPFNKKSGSMLGRPTNSPSGSEDSNGPAETTNEVAAARTRPKRENRTKAVYVLMFGEPRTPITARNAHTVLTHWVRKAIRKPDLGRSGHRRRRLSGTCLFQVLGHPNQDEYYCVDLTLLLYGFWRRAVHVSSYDKNVDELVPPSVVPDHVIDANSDKYWSPHPTTGVFGPADEGRASAAGGEKVAAGPGSGPSALDQTVWFRPLEDLDKPPQP
ncbi:hypothetical protein GW17_00001395 [Ensete ventricosum]|nr:hypothetical protein GW17_00001395 [Ensete ventricosum]RZR89200.1 hypothetical protein BHM03_00016880 [Ensete ventricosum]